MKSIVVYYSLEGNCKLIAESIAKEIGADTLELKLKKPIPTSGPMKYVIGGKSAMMQESPQLQNTSFNMTDYDLVIIGSPVWAGTYAPAIRSFAEVAEIEEKKIALFACSGGGPTEKCISNMKNLFEGNELLSDISFINPLKEYQESSVKAKSWAKTLL